MICSHCGDLLVEDRFMDWAARWRCLKCGHEDQIDACRPLFSTVETEQAKCRDGRIRDQNVLIPGGGEDGLEKGPVIWRVVNDKYAHGNGASAWLKWQ